MPPRWLFIKIETDEGIAGWGEPVIEGRAATVEAAVGELADHLIGHDPSRIEDIWQMLYRGGFYRGGPILMSAIAGIDQALWDIKGKVLGAPVHDLLGGRVCASACGCTVDRRRTAGDVGAGHRGWSPRASPPSNERHPELSIVDSTRPDRGGGSPRRRGPCSGRVPIRHRIDFTRVHRTMAKVLLHELGPFHPMFVEETVLPGNLHVCQHSPRGSDIRSPPASVFHRSQFRTIWRPARRHLQPDISHCGGITEIRKIATMAETYDVAWRRTVPLGR